MGDRAWGVLRDRASLNLLKGNIEGGNWAISHGEFSRFFSRENLRVVKRAITFPSFFSREIMKVVIRVIALPPVLLKGNNEGRNQGDRILPVLLKGNFEGGNWAISHGECFANALP